MGIGKIKPLNLGNFTPLLTPGIFITGTDTGVGKTTVAAGLAGALKHRGYSVGVMKPVQSGAGVKNNRLYSQDAEILIAAAGSNDDEALVCPYLFREPFAPCVAAEMEGKTIDIEVIKNSYKELERRHDIVIVEGAGGIAVPIKGSFLVSDLILHLNLPAIIVSRAGLGTINHTFLTAEYAKARRIPVIGVIVNDYRGGIVEQTNPEMIAKLTGVQILGIIPHDEAINDEKGKTDNTVSLIEKHVNLNLILNQVSSSASASFSAKFPT